MASVNSVHRGALLNVLIQCHIVTLNDFYMSPTDTKITVCELSQIYNTVY